MSTAIVAAYLTAYNRLRLLTGIQVAALWDRHGGLTDETLEQFVARVLPVMAGAEHAQARLTVAYLTALRQQTLGSAPRVNLNVNDLVGVNLRGVEPTEVFARPTVTARTAISEGKDFADAMQLGRIRANELATTNVMLTQRATVSAMGKTDKRVVGYRRVLTGASCNLCATVSTQRYHRGDLHPVHAHCIPPGSVVSGSPILALTRRWYVGELIIIRTAAGEDLSVTPNHPVLTDRGWRPAGIVQEGDDLFRYGPLNRAVDGRPNEKQPPALVEDVWRANAVRGLVSMPLAAEDLHADGAGTDGEIDVVWTDRYLSSKRDVFVGDPFGDSQFISRRPSRPPLVRQRTSALLSEGVFTATDSRMGGSSLGLALCGRHLRSAVQSSAASVARYDAPTEQFTLESAAVYASKGMNLVRRLAGEVEPDRVIETRRVSFRDHVYNLYTDEGWYSSNNHIVSNCDCGVAEIYGTADPGRVINSKLLGELKSKQTAEGVVRSEALHSAQQRSAQAATRIREMRAQLPGESDPARKARLEDRLAQWEDRKSTADLQVAAHRAPQVDEPVVHIHGELGPLLTVKGQHFDGPSVVH